MNNLEVKALSVSYEKPVLKEISFTLLTGRTLGILGESGSGKSTLCHVIAGLTLAKKSGMILFAGKDLLSISPKEFRAIRQKIGIIFQNPFTSLTPTMRISKQLNEYALGNIKEILKKVQLAPSLLDRYPHQLSGGQIQRVMIAIALLKNPLLLIADEPTTSLDICVQMEILSLLKELSLTTLFISHDSAVLKYISHEILVLCEGQIMEKGSAEHVFLNPLSPYTRFLLNGTAKERQLPTAFCPFASRCPYFDPLCHPLLFGTEEHFCSCPKGGLCS